MVPPWVRLASERCQELKELGDKIGKPVSEMIRETVSRFVGMKDYHTGAMPSYLPRGSRDDRRTVTAHFTQAEWDLVVSVSQDTGKSKTELLREATDEYLRQLPRSRKGKPWKKTTDKGKF